MALTRKDAKLIAEELVKLLRYEVKGTMEEITKDETEEFICLKDAAMLLGISPSTLYKTKDIYGCYSKIGNRILFAKFRLIRAINSGALA